MTVRHMQDERARYVGLSPAERERAFGERIPLRMDVYDFYRSHLRPGDRYWVQVEASPFSTFGGQGDDRPRGRPDGAASRGRGRAAAGSRRDPLVGLRSGPAPVSLLGAGPSRVAAPLRLAGAAMTSSVVTLVLANVAYWLVGHRRVPRARGRRPARVDLGVDPAAYLFGVAVVVVPATYLALVGIAVGWTAIAFAAVVLFAIGFVRLRRAPPPPSPSGSARPPPGGCFASASRRRCSRSPPPSSSSPAARSSSRRSSCGTAGRSGRSRRASSTSFPGTPPLCSEARTTARRPIHSRCPSSRRSASARSAASTGPSSTCSCSHSPSDCSARCGRSRAAGRGASSWASLRSRS